MKKYIKTLMLIAGASFNGVVQANQPVDTIQDILMCKYAKTAGIDYLMQIAASNNNNNANITDYEDNHHKRYSHLGQIFKNAVLVREASVTEIDNLSYIGETKTQHKVVSQFYNLKYVEVEDQELRVQTKLNFENLQSLVESTNNIKLNDYTSLIKKNFIGIHVHPVTGANHYPTRVSGFTGKYKGSDYGVYVYEYKNDAYVACGLGLGSNMANLNMQWMPEYKGEHIKN